MRPPDHIREDFSREPLELASLASEPMTQFESWFLEACTIDPEAPNALSLATASSAGRPSVRTVLLKLYDESGFIFFTNYGSRKGRDLSENPFGSMLFPWTRQGRQVIANGPVTRISSAESLKYFLSRSRGSQLGAWTSTQSSVISTRSVLESKLYEMKSKFSRGEIPLPTFWGGYRLEPETVEFWQGQANRLHDRFLYSRDASGPWQIERLAP